MDVLPNEARTALIDSNTRDKEKTMRAIRAFIRSFMWVELAAMAGLILGGVALTVAERGSRFGDSFFTYRIEHLDHLPAWFAFGLALMAVNGFWMFKLSDIRGVLHTPSRSGYGEYGASVPIHPLQLFAINLIAIPTALALFILIRANGW